MLPKICSFPECGRSGKITRSWCAAHYKQHRRGRGLTPIVKRGSICSIPECGKVHMARGLCNTHYARFLRHGDPTVNLADISANERFWAKVNKSGDCWLWTAPLARNGYGLITDDHKKQGYVHRYSYEVAKGPIPGNMVIDHMCHVRHCVNPDHLRAVTVKQNAENRAGAQSNSSTGVRGVHWVKDRHKWAADVRSEGRTIHLGNFGSIAEAEAAVIQKRLELFTHNDLDRIRV